MGFAEQTRRAFLKTIGYAAASAGALSAGCAEMGQTTRAKRNPPNIILVLTDDQGFGDVGFHGNTKIRTPNLDKFAEKGVEFTQFYVCPVCSPTRASLMTGRYTYRTGVTNVGGAGDRMNAREVTIAEALRRAGYATAIFGKWHIGDNYPMRPQDKGFAEAVIHKACCLTPWFRPGGENYFDPLLFHNGKLEKYKGYCMDVYTDLTIEFAEKNRNKPFFVYLSTNTPHDPLAIGEEYVAPYRAMGLSENTARTYGTITNIDDNFGRLLAGLKKLGLYDNTIVIFLTDNGQAGRRYTAGLRGGKSWVYEGGIRVPCVVSWPGGFKGGRKVDRIAAHIDLMPTLLDVCGVSEPAGAALDGVSLLPLLCNDDVDWPDRTLFVQWHQGLHPQLYRAFAVRNQKYKLVQAQGHWAGPFAAAERKFELFDIANDPFEKNDISAKYPEMVAKMKQQYEAWFKDVMRTRGAEPQRIYLGTPYENPARLLANSSLVNQDVIPQIVLGHWPVQVKHSGRYEVTVGLSEPAKSAGAVYFKLADVRLSKAVSKGTSRWTFSDVHLKKGPGRLEARLDVDGKRIVPTFIDVQRLD